MVNLRANISGGEHYIDNREMALQTVKVPYVVPKIHELWCTNGYK